MSWKQCTIPFASDVHPIQEALFAISMARARIEGKVRPDLALFTRDEDFERTILLLSPEASKHAHDLPGAWGDAVDIHDHGWAVLYSSGVQPPDLGLRWPERG
jgi:hypothetical protein